MATLAMIKWFVEGTDLAAAAQKDVNGITSGTAADASTTVRQDYEDLSFALLEDPEYQDILNSGYSTAKGRIEKASSDTQTYLKGTNITVEAFDRRGDVNLIFGNTCASMWDLVECSGAQFSVTYNWVWNEYGHSDDLSADWGSLPQQGISYHESQDRYGIVLSEWGTSCAHGTGDQWAPYMHLHYANASALNSDVFI